MPATLAQRAVIATCGRHGLGPVDALRQVLAELDLVATPMDLRRTLGLMRGAPRQLAETLLEYMPRSGAESYAGYHLWFHAGDNHHGRDWFASIVPQPVAEPPLVELQQLARAVIDDDDLVRRFEKEHRRLAELQHPHVVPCVDHGVVPEAGPYRCIPYRESPTLGRLLERRGTLTVPEVLTVAIQAGMGLDALHDAGLLHRDLDVDGVVVAPSGLVQVLDAGRAGDRPLTVPPSVSPLTPRGIQDWAGQDRNPGTRRWRKVDRTRLELWLLPPNPMAPEVVAGGMPDRRTDVYRLGALLVLALTGSEDPATLERLPALDHGLVRLLRACKDVDPARRPTAAEVVAYGEAVRETLRLPRQQPMTGRIVRPG